MSHKIKIQTKVNAPIEKVWAFWTDTKYIMKWNTPSPDWHTTKATNDLQVGGKFCSTMAAKDGSMSFDFCGIYDDIIPLQKIAYTLEDNRKVEIVFEEIDNEVQITEVFEAENQNSLEMQQQGWQAILDNFKSCVEKN
ncbi:SRPBCC family protein [Flavobacterium ponti]|uniref:SRPBCC family protein n=1 Tax=Flavobacterium ponti TaxID=665133 RepID=A0ABV9P3E0_9FLAO